ncbi:MAG TPA: hypothetical protein VLF62_03150 [Candidatus Saccharimonadales bacterium]|nr:hypothetical protein [Candidatus Saccharimonadales bacterium]
MSSSAVSNTGGSYLVSFTATTAAKNVRIDFCSNSPLYSDSCTTPTGFSAASAAIGTGGTGIDNTWSITGAAGNVTVSKSSAYSAGGISFTLTGITNPSTVGTFYARIYTYVAQSNDYTAAATPGTVADFGGIALSTANLISITAKVQETLTFCVSGADLSPSSDCTSATTPTLTLGHGTPAILDQTAVDASSAYTQVSTNANTGISMRMKSNNTCTNGGLSSNGGTTCNIPGVPTSSGGVAQAIAAGTAAFGMYIANSTTSTTTSPAVTGSGTITPDANYHSASHVTIPTDLWYGMDQDATNGVIGTYGDVIATSSGPLSLANNRLVFAATASLTTQAGIYTVNESIITTGTF